MMPTVVAVVVVPAVPVMAAPDVRDRGVGSRRTLLDQAECTGHGGGGGWRGSEGGTEDEDPQACCGQKQTHVALPKGGCRRTSPAPSRSPLGGRLK